MFGPHVQISLDGFKVVFGVKQQLAANLYVIVDGELRIERQIAVFLIIGVKSSTQGNAILGHEFRAECVAGIPNAIQCGRRNSEQQNPWNVSKYFDHERKVENYGRNAEAQESVRVERIWVLTRSMISVRSSGWMIFL